MCSLGAYGPEIAQSRRTIRGITPRELTGDALVELLASPFATEPSVAGGVFIVDGTPGSGEALEAAVRRLSTTPCVVIGRAGWSEAADNVRHFVDVIVEDDAALDAIVDTVTRTPIASAAFALHLRAAERRSIADGLVAESALYSTLQSGPEFAAWRAATPVRERASAYGQDAVAVTRDAATLRIELARPEVRNALNAQMRDELLDALAIAAADPAIHVLITGRGQSFSSGGDLDEFGTFANPAGAHILRLDRSIGAVIAGIADRVTVEIHGACQGSGIELPAFAGRVVAHTDTAIALPELGLGLIPGAGGTVSIPARIGRHRTALLALTRTTIDAPTALQWGLVDEVTSL